MEGYYDRRRAAAELRPVTEPATDARRGAPPRPPRPPKAPRRRPAAMPAREPDAVLLYRCETSNYIANLNGMPLEYRLVATPLPAPAGVRVHPLLYLSRPQLRYTSRNQCNEMLQGPTVDGQKVFLSGLRVVPVPGAAESVVAGLRVGDYKFNHLDRQEYPRTMVALFGKATDSRPGWMLLVICWDSYKSRYRNVNAVFATARVRQVYARLPAWLQLLSTDTPD